MPTAIPYNRGGGTALTPNWAKQLTLANAPAEMEFALEIGTGSSPLVFRGDVDTQTLQTLLESYDGLTGYGVNVLGGTQQSGTGGDGVALYTGSFTIILAGGAPYPAWGTVQNSAVQVLEVEDGDPPVIGEPEHYLVSGAGDDDWNGQYDADGTVNGKPAFKKDETHYLFADEYWGGPCWCLHVFKATAPGQIIQPGQEPYYYADSTAGTPPTSGWLTEFGSPPAPTMSFAAGSAGSGQYTLNGGSEFYLSATASELQANQRALGGDYAAVVAKGISPETAALFHFYFPFAAGSVSPPSATGTGATASTLYGGGSASELVTCTDADLDALLIGGLQNPAGGGAPAPFTPNGSRWYDPGPATTAEAINRMAAMFYNWMLDAIP